MSYPSGSHHHVSVLMHRRYRKKNKGLDGPLSPSAKDDIPLHEKMEKAMPVMNLKSCQSMHT